VADASFSFMCSLYLISVHQPAVSAPSRSSYHRHFKFCNIRPHTIRFFPHVECLFHVSRRPCLPKLRQYSVPRAFAAFQSRPEFPAENPYRNHSDVSRTSPQSPFTLFAPLRRLNERLDTIASQQRVARGALARRSRALRWNRRTCFDTFNP